MSESLLEELITLELWAHPTLPETKELITKLQDNGYKVIHHHSYRSQPACSVKGETTYSLKEISKKYLNQIEQEI